LRDPFPKKVSVLADYKPRPVAARFPLPGTAAPISPRSKG
jgi:hypothetical protein